MPAMGKSINFVDETCLWRNCNFFCDLLAGDLNEWLEIVALIQTLVSS